MLVLIFGVEHFLVFHLIVSNLCILGAQKPGSKCVDPLMFPLRSCSTFMAGAPALERKLTGVEGTVDVDAALQVSWICFRSKNWFSYFIIPPHPIICHLSNYKILFHHILLRSITLFHHIPLIYIYIPIRLYSTTPPLHETLFHHIRLLTIRLYSTTSYKIIHHWETHSCWLRLLWTAFAEFRTSWRTRRRRHVQKTTKACRSGWYFYLIDF